MAQFDVYKNTNKSTRSSYPYLVEVQADMLSELRTTIVIPLLAKKGHAGTQLNILHPEFDISGQKYLAMTTLIAGIDRESLGDCIASLAESRDDFISAVDFMITGI